MIDKVTVQQIIDAADIVEVVSDFVNLRRRGANYIGLCPFHNEKTPSFSVSRAKGICKCFSCGKGGSAVNFIMEHEQISYYEALKYLAKKYHIEIKERELTDKEKEEQTERESMFIVNEYASKYFENVLTGTPEGKAIGLSYFYERGFSDLTIKKFNLGYSLEEKDALYRSAISKGYNPKYLFSTGLCVDKNGIGYDRYKGRVMFPVFNLAGKVVAFGGRTLKKDLAKYINSPESIIYKKSFELYGLYQAKQAIIKKEKCFLVEGYTDVISMHQAGIENVVASSGTSLTEGQIRLIHRFTNEVTVLYDGDAAGIKASLRGIDMLLAEGLNIKVLLLPDGDDPDSFARKHNATEFQTYIDEHETDFIRFKTKILLEGTEDDPLSRSNAIQDIVKTISIIPFPVTQAVYVKECSRLLDINEDVLLREIQKVIAGKARATYKPANEPQENASDTKNGEIKKKTDLGVKVQDNRIKEEHKKILFPYEISIIRYIVKYGMAPFCSQMGDENEILVIEYIADELNRDNMHFITPLFGEIFSISQDLISKFKDDYNKKRSEFEEYKKIEMKKGIDEIKESINTIQEIEQKEMDLHNRINNQIKAQSDMFQCNYLEKLLCSYPNDNIRNMAIKLCTEKHELSKIHTKYASIPSEFECLQTLLPTAIYNWKYGIVQCKINDIQKILKKSKDANQVEASINTLGKLIQLRRKLSEILGERVISPKL